MQVHGNTLIKEKTKPKNSIYTHKWYTFIARFPRPAIDAVASIRPLQVHARTSIAAQSLVIGTLIDIYGQECIYKLNSTMLICHEKKYQPTDHNYVLSMYLNGF